MAKICVCVASVSKMCNIPVVGLGYTSGLMFSTEAVDKELTSSMLK